MIQALVLTLFWMLLFITKTSTMNKVVQLIFRHIVGKYYSFHVSPLVVCLYLDRTVRQLKPPKNIHTTIKPPRQRTTTYNTHHHQQHTNTNCIMAWNNINSYISVQWPYVELSYTSSTDWHNFHLVEPYYNWFLTFTTAVMFHPLYPIGLPSKNLPYPWYLWP